MNAHSNWFSIQGTPGTKGGGSSSPSSVSRFSTVCVLAYGLDLSKRPTSICRIKCTSKQQASRTATDECVTQLWWAATCKSSVWREWPGVNFSHDDCAPQLRHSYGAAVPAVFIISPSFAKFISNPSENGAPISSVQGTLPFSECHSPRSTNGSPRKETRAHDRYRMRSCLPLI